MLLDELGFVPFEKAGGELLFDVLSPRHERAATVITSNLAFSEWNRVLGDDTRRSLKTLEMRFSLVVSVIGPGVYATIKPRVEAAATIPVEV